MNVDCRTRDRWTSWHLHVEIAGTQGLDRVIRDVVAPALDGLRRRRQLGLWFFLRYWKDGPHVRLRVRDLEPNAALDIETELADKLTTVGQVAGENRLDEASYRAIAAAGENGVPLPIGSLRALGVYREAYTPEFERYGGVELMEASEALFHISSELCLELLRIPVPHRPTATALALRATAAAVPALGTAMALRFLEESRDTWLRWAGAEPRDASLIQASRKEAARLRQQPGAVTQLLEGRGAPFYAWTSEICVATRGWREVEAARVEPGLAARILASHLHVTNNRLGLGSQQEILILGTLCELVRSSEG